MKKIPLPQIITDQDWPIRYTDYEIDKAWLGRLLEVMAKDRPRRFNQILFSGGIVTQTVWNRAIKKHHQLPRIKAGEKINLIYGYFDPLKQKIVLFPETVLAVVCQELQFPLVALKSHRLSAQAQQLLLERMDQKFYPVLLEEIEHGFQNPNSKPYRSILEQIVAWTAPALPIYVILSVFYVELNRLTRWWHLLILLGLLLWFFLPVWTVWFPKPHWYQNLVYRFNRREHDAKGQTISPKRTKLARKAVQFRLKLTQPD